MRLDFFGDYKVIWLTRLNLVFLLLVLMSCDQKKKYWLYFNQEHSKEEVLVALKQYEIDIDYYSKWLHAGTAHLTSKQENQLLSNNLIAECVPALSGLKMSSVMPRILNEEMSFALKQIEAETFISRGLTGKGVKIGIIDGGFLNADNREDLAHFFLNHHVKAYKDFITPFLGQYKGAKSLDDGHGTDVWTNIGGIKPSSNVRFGLATEADYYLARTDHGKGESKSEEEFLIAALEWLDSMDVKLVNISLGYTNGFDDPSNNHTPDDIDGYKTAITRACQYAADKRGMLLIIAAGNDGNTPWRVLSAPADAQGVIAVGATSYKRWEKTGYSSIGPPLLPYLKPNVSCFSYNGTSFSAPVITGLAACIWQMDSTLSNYQVKGLIEKSSSLYPFGNNYIGYGVPSCRRLLERQAMEFSQAPKKILVFKKKISLELSEEYGEAILFHKSDSIHVLKQERALFFDSKIEITRHKKSKQTTLSINDFTRELVWEE